MTPLPSTSVPPTGFPRIYLSRTYDTFVVQDSSMCSGSVTDDVLRRTRKWWSLSRKPLFHWDPGTRTSGEDRKGRNWGYVRTSQETETPLVYSCADNRFDPGRSLSFPPYYLILHSGVVLDLGESVYASVTKNEVALNWGHKIRKWP